MCHIAGVGCHRELKPVGWLSHVTLPVAPKDICNLTYSNSRTAAYRLYVKLKVQKPLYLGDFLPYRASFSRYFKSLKMSFQKKYV